MLRLAAILAVVALALGGWFPHGKLFGTTYYLSPTGNDSNNGLSSGAPWLTPNHALNCGDIISQAAGSYTATNFEAGKWGTVSNCPSSTGIYFAQLQCAGPSPESCTYDEYVHVDKSNWAVVGGKVTTPDAGCFNSTPSSAATIHHVAFINVIASGCSNNGVTTFPYISDTTKGVDYFAVVGAIVYNGATGNAHCYSGVSLYEPVAFDTTAGTHQYVAGVFSYGNIDPNPCEGHVPGDGQGLFFDDWSHSQQTGVAYTQQGVIEQNIAMGNGASGVAIFNNVAAPVIVTQNTIWGNYQDPNHDPSATYNGELIVNHGVTTGTTRFTNNLVQASKQTQGQAVYACYVGSSDGTVTVSGNYCSGVAGNNTHVDSSPGFSFGTNTLADPQFVAAATPPPPSCASFPTTTSCMASVIANFVAQAAGAAGLGYQSPGPCAPNSNYPVWLKGLVKDGIVNKPCGL